MQPQIIHRPNPTETQTGKPAAAAVHQRPTDGAERASHRVACADGFAGGVGGQFVLAADVEEGGGFDGELGVEVGVSCEISSEVEGLGVGRTFEANIVAVTLRQSLQWQTCVLTRPSPSTGCLASVASIQSIGGGPFSDGGMYSQPQAAQHHNNTSPLLSAP
jgi:hypothetical protein